MSRTTKRTHEADVGKGLQAKMEAADLCYVSPSELVPWGKNPRRNDEAVEFIAKSIKQFGFGAPIVARRNGEIIAGHTRWKAAKELGLEQVPVRYMDLTEAEAHALAVADNRLGELAKWDDEVLADIMEDLTIDDALLVGFDRGDYVSELTEQEVGENNPDLEAYIKRRKGVHERQLDKLDTSSYVVLVFQSTRQRKEFVRSIQPVDSYFEVFLDGEQVAEKFGVKLLPEDKKPFNNKVSKKMADLAIE